MKWVLALVVVAGGVLRFVPIWFGLPYMHARPDEETAIGHAVAVLGGDLNPHFFHWPSLTFYLFAGLFGVSSRIGERFFQDPTLTPAELTLIARACVATAGTLTLVWLFRIGRRVGGTVVGLLAALFLSVSILHVRESHFAMTDVLMTLLVVVSLERLLHAIDVNPAERKGDSRVVKDFAIAGVAGGLAASTKYSAAAVLASMMAAQLIVVWPREGRRRWWQLGIWLPAIAFVSAFAAAFVAATPYAVLDYTHFAEDFEFDITHLSGGHAGDFGHGWSYHVARSLPFGVGVPTCVAAIAGVLPFVRHYRAHALVLGAFAASLCLSIGGGRTVFFRYVLPLVPIVCVAAAVGVKHVVLWCTSRMSVSTSMAAVALATLVAMPSAVNCVWFDAILGRTDTRVLAADWLAANTQPTQSLAEAPDEYAQLEFGRIVHEWYFDEATGGFVNAGTRVPDWLVLHESPLWTYARVPPSLRALAADRYELAFVSRGTKGAARSAVYDMQDAFFMPVSGFSTVERPGPTVFIYRRVR
jgi:Dolichyl-phosphate-mannose-protein mannosyltransferase